MISERIGNVLNTQINKEFYSAYLYLSVAVFFNSISLFGFEHWCKDQAKEEISHGMKFFNFVLQNGGKIELKQITPPDITFKTTIDTFKIIYNHEKHISESINNIALLAEEENERLTGIFLNEFIIEQAEEEQTVNDILTKLRLYGDEKCFVYQLDKELLER